MARTYTVSPCDQELTLVEVFSGKQGAEGRVVTRYHGTSPGKSLFGEWKSFLRTRDSHRPITLTLGAGAQGGPSLRFANSHDQAGDAFDGEPHTDHGPHGALDTTTTSRRVDAHVIRVIRVEDTAWRP